MNDSDSQRDTQSESLARQRYAILSLLRLSGVGVALLGLLLLGEKLSVGDSTIDRVAGASFVVLGTLGVLILPSLLARRWKSSGKR